MDIDFIKPARIDDLLTVKTAFANHSGARVRLEQTIMRGDTTLAAATVTIVTITDAGRATRLPETLRGLFLAG